MRMNGANASAAIATGGAARVHFPMVVSVSLSLLEEAATAIMIDVHAPHAQKMVPVN